MLSPFFGFFLVFSPPQANCMGHPVRVPRPCPGAQPGTFERGRSYIYNRKDGIIHDLSPSIKCVAPLFRDMSLAKYEMQEGARAPKRHSCAPGHATHKENHFFACLIVTVAYSKVFLISSFPIPCSSFDGNERFN